MVVIYAALFTLGAWAPTLKENVVVRSGQGVKTIAFVRTEGTVRVYLPDDIRPGDTITGTVVSEPTGKSGQELLKNESVLNGLVVDVDGQTQKGPGRLKFKLSSAAMGLMPILLKNPGGKTQSKTGIPLLSNSEGLPAVDSPGPQDYAIPPICQSGNFLPIPGAFDGDTRNTSVKIGGQTCAIFAESPRACLALAPRTAEGQQTLELKEQGFTAVSPIQNVRVSLSAPKTTLLKGESTTVSVKVSGLAGVNPGLFPIPFQFSNLSPTQITMGSGSAMSVSLIQPEAVKDGTWTSSTSIQATLDGEFQVQGTIYFDFNDDRKAKLPAKAINAWLAHIASNFEAELKAKEKDPNKATRVEILRKVIGNLKGLKVTDNNELERSAVLRAVDAQLNLITALDVGAALVDVAADLLGYKDLPMGNVLDLLEALRDQNAIGNGELLKKAIELSTSYQALNDAKQKVETLGKLKAALKELQENLQKQIAN